MAERKCSVPECEGKFYGRGLCQKHYQREWKAGRFTPRTLEQRFNEKHEICPETGCWLWTANTNNCGYGQIWVDGKQALAHRLSYELHVGPIPEGLFVCHRCDQPPCIRPDHLFLGTHQDNVDDKVQKGRHPKGSASVRAKLTEEQALEIYHAEGTHHAIAARYEVARSLVSTIKLKKIWKHIHDEFRPQS